MNKKRIVLLICLIGLLFLMNYSWMDSYVIKYMDSKEKGIAGRVIDGDTIVIGNNSIRLLGINTPERGEKYYEEAKKFLEDLILNKTIEIEKGRDDLDKYDRQLRYVFFEKENVNLKLIEQGFANPYFLSGKDKYSKNFYNAWDNCILKNINLCEKSKNKCSDCIFLKKLNYKTGEVILENMCSFNCDLTGWTIKAEGRKIIEINEIVKSNNELNIKQDIWTDIGDSFYLRDKEGKLVLYYNY